MKGCLATLGRIAIGLLIIGALWLLGAFLGGLLLGTDGAFILAAVGMVIGCKISVYYVMDGAYPEEGAEGKKH